MPFTNSDFDLGLNVGVAVVAIPNISYTGLVRVYSIYRELFPPRFAHDSIAV